MSHKRPPMSPAEVRKVLAGPGTWEEQCAKVKRAGGGVYPPCWWDVAMRPALGPPAAPASSRRRGTGGPS